MTERFTPPWEARETPGGYVVEDKHGRPLVYVYGEDKVSVGTSWRLTKDQARRIAVNVARLPELLSPAAKPPTDTPQAPAHPSDPPTGLPTN